MTNRTTEEIARGLTEAQRRALISGDDDGLPEDEFKQLFDMGILRFCNGWRTMLTDPLGLAVRSHLESHKP